jgi:hypothetical protein
MLRGRVSNDNGQPDADATIIVGPKEPDLSGTVPSAGSQARCVSP